MDGLFGFLFILVTLVSFLAPPLMLLGGWLTWSGMNSRFPSPQWRSVLGFASLALVTGLLVANAVMFFVVAGNLQRIGLWLGWIRIHFYLCILAFLMALVGKGFRIPVIGTGLGMIFATFLIYLMK